MPEGLDFSVPGDTAFRKNAQHVFGFKHVVHSAVGVFQDLGIFGAAGNRNGFPGPENEVQHRLENRRLHKSDKTGWG